jgi:hypothetical protein
MKDYIEAVAAAFFMAIAFIGFVLIGMLLF